MQKVWEDNSPAAKFWRQLVRDRATEYMRDPGFLRDMRHDYTMVREYQKRFGRVWEEYSTNIYKLIAEACGECWDSEDEEKKEAAVNQRIDDDLVAAREKDPRGREHELQGEPEASVGLLEEGRCSRRRKGSAEEAAQEKGKSSRRGEDFYRRAGSS
jgi:hypothetical protein